MRGWDMRMGVCIGFVLHNQHACKDNCWYLEVLLWGRWCGDQTCQHGDESCLCWINLELWIGRENAAVVGDGSVEEIEQVMCQVPVSACNGNSVPLLPYTLLSASTHACVLHTRTFDCACFEFNNNLEKEQMNFRWSIWSDSNSCRTDLSYLYTQLQSKCLIPLVSSPWWAE